MPKVQTKATTPTPAPDTPLPVEYAVRIYPVKDSKFTLANANVDINGVFAIRGVKVIRGEKGPFVAMPQYCSFSVWPLPRVCSSFWQTF